MQVWTIMETKKSSKCGYLFADFTGQEIDFKCTHQDSIASDRTYDCTKENCPLKAKVRKSSYAYKAEQDKIAQELGYKDAEEAMVGLYKKDPSLSKIATKFKVSYPTVSRRLKILGVEISGRGGPNRKTSITRAMYDDIMSGKYKNKTMALRCGISEPIVSKIKHGYVPDIRG